MILSEFAGAAQEFPNATVVNPFNIDEVAQALKEALNLTAQEKQKMIASMKVRVIKYDARYWAESFIHDLTAERDVEDVYVDTKEISLEAIRAFTFASGSRKTY